MARTAVRTVGPGRTAATLLNSNSTLLSGVAEHHEGKEMAQQIVNAQQIEDMYDSGVPHWIKHDLWCPVPSGGYTTVRQPVWSCNGSTSFD